MVTDLGDQGENRSFPSQMPESASALVIERDFLDAAEVPRYSEHLAIFQ